MFGPSWKEYYELKRKVDRLEKLVGNQRGTVREFSDCSELSSVPTKEYEIKPSGIFLRLEKLEKKR